MIGRSELFTENFFDPVAAAIDQQGASVWVRWGRLLILVLVLNLVGGTVMAAIFAVDGALPTGAHEVFVSVAEEIAAKSSPGSG